MGANLQRFIVPRDALYLFHHVFDGLEEVRALDVKLVLWRLGLIFLLLGDGPDDDKAVSGPLFVIGHKRARFRHDLGTGVLVLPTSPSSVIVINALYKGAVVSARKWEMIVRRTLIFKLGGDNGATVVCCDFASAISVLTDSSSSSPTAGSFSGGLGPAGDEGERKIVETRFMVMAEEGWGLEGFLVDDWRHEEGFYT